MNAVSASSSSPVPSRAPARRFPGNVVAIGLMVFILVVAAVAWVIHQQNIYARSRAADDARAAEAAERGASPATGE